IIGGRRKKKETRNKRFGSCVLLLVSSIHEASRHHRWAPPHVPGVLRHSPYAQNVFRGANECGFWGRFHAFNTPENRGTGCPALLFRCRRRDVSASGECHV